MTRTTLAIALLLALTAAPDVQAKYITNSFLDAGFGFNFGNGAGLYDPARAPDPTAYCFALLSFTTTLSPVSYYYTPLNRYWPNAAVGVFWAGPVGGLNDPTDCATLVVDNWVWVGPVLVDVGLAFTVSDNLGPDEVADLSATTMTLQYCTAPQALATQGTPHTEVNSGGPLLAAWSADNVPCTVMETTHQLYPGCSSFSLNTAVGSVSNFDPVFLSDNECNSHDNSPSTGDFVTTRCVASKTFNTVTGVSTVEGDGDFWVIGNVLSLNPGGLLAWSLTSAVGPPVRLLQNVDDLTQSGC